MPQYRITKTSLIEGRIVQPGAIVEYDGNPGSAFEALDAAGEKRKKEHEEERKRTIDPAGESLGRGMAKGFNDANAANKKSKDEADKDAVAVVLIPAVEDSLTTVGHSSVSQKSAGGVDAENLLEADGKGGLVPQNPHSDAKPATKADSPDDGAIKEGANPVTGKGSTADNEQALKDAKKAAAAAPSRK